MGQIWYMTFVKVYLSTALLVGIFWKHTTTLQLLSGRAECSSEADAEKQSLQTDIRQSARSTFCIPMTTSHSDIVINSRCLRRFCLSGQYIALTTNKFMCAVTSGIFYGTPLPPETKDEETKKHTFTHLNIYIYIHIFIYAFITYIYTCVCTYTYAYVCIEMEIGTKR